MPTMMEMYRKTQNGMTKSKNHGLNTERATPTRDTRASELLNHSRSNLIHTLYCGISSMGNLPFRAVRAASRNSKPTNFWQRKTAEWQMEEERILLAMQGLQQAHKNLADLRPGSPVTRRASQAGSPVCAKDAH